MRLHPVLIVTLAFFLVFLGYNPPQQFMLAIFEERGEGALAQQVLVLLYVTIAIVGLVLPGIAHRLGSVRSTMIGAAATYALFVLVVASGHRSAMLGAAVVLGIGGTVLWGTMSRIIVTYGSEAGQGRSFGLVSVATSVAIAIGNKAFHRLWKPLGNNTFLVFTGAIVASIAIFALLPRERLEDAPAKSNAATKEGNGGLWLALALMSIHCCNAAWGGAINGGLMLFGKEHYGEAWINVIVVTPLVYCVAVIGGGWLTDRVGGVRTLLGSCCCFLGGVLLMTMFHKTVSWYSFGACIVAAAHGAIYAGVTGSIKALLNERARKFACYGLSTGGGVAIAIALIVSRMSVEVTFGLLIAAAAASCAIAGILFGVVKAR